MRKKTRNAGEKIVKDIKRATRKHYSSEEKIRIVSDGLRGEDSIAELCRREGISQGLYYKWSKDFMEAGKRGPKSAMPAKSFLTKVELCETIAHYHTGLSKTGCYKVGC